MKSKSEEYQLIEAAQMRTFYASMAIGKEVAEPAIKTGYDRHKPSLQKGKPKRRRKAA